MLIPHTKTKLKNKKQRILSKTRKPTPTRTEKNKQTHFSLPGTQATLLKKKISSIAYLHLVLLFWNHVFTWASVMLSCLASCARSLDAKYFCLLNRFSSSFT